MDSIKKILSPGKHKDDEVLHNQGSSTAQQNSGSTTFESGVPQGSSNAPELHTLPQQKEHGVLRQIINPGGEKYDNSAYGNTATTDASASSVATSSEHEPKHGILRQIFNPGSEKYDPAQYEGSDDVLAKPVAEGQRIPGALATGSSAQQIESQEAASSGNGVLRQILNPGGDKYDGEGFQPTSQVGSGSSTNAHTYGSNATTQGSHAGRDAALDGAIAGSGAGALAHEQSRDRYSHGQTTGDPSFPLGSSTGATTSSGAAPQYSTINTQSGHGQVPGGSAAAYGITKQSTDIAPSSAGRPASDATAATAGVLGARGIAAHEHERHDRHDTSSTTAGSLDTSNISARDPGYGTTSPDPHRDHHHHHGEEVAAVGAGTTAVGGIAAHEHNNPSTTSTSGYQGDSGLSHHVYNGVTEQVPARAGHRDFSGPRPVAHHTSEPVYEPTPFHATPAATTGHSDQSGLSHRVYNSIAGKHSGHEQEPGTNSLQHQEHIGAATGLAGASLADRTRTGISGLPSTDQNTGASGLLSTGRETEISGLSSADQSTGVASGSGAGTALSDHSNASTLVSSSRPDYDTGTSSRHVPGAFPPEFSSSAYGEAGALGGTAAAALAAQEAMRRHETQQGVDTYGVRPSNHSTSNTGAFSSAPSVQQGSTIYSSTPSTQQSSNTGPYTSTPYADTTGPASKTVSPHDSNFANIADARAKPEPEQQKTSTTTGPHQSDMLNKLDPRVQSDPDKAEKHETHTGRDAALGVGAGAATGAGIYEAEKHHGGQQPSTYGSSTGSTGNTSQKTSSNTAGPHSSSLMNKLDPRVKSDQVQTESQHGFTGRDATTGTGAGAATGAGIYEADREHTTHASDGGYGSTSNTTPTSTSGYGTSSAAPYKSSSQTGYGSSSTAGPHNSSLMNKLDPRVKNDQTQTEESHAGRDTARVGGAGAADVGAYEAEKYHGHHQTSTGTTQQSSAQTSNTGIHHESALLNKLDPRVKNEPAESRVEHAHHSHTGRDAAIGAGAGAATGAGVYETEKHHGDYHDHYAHHGHTGEDATIGTGAGATTGAGVYEAEKHHGLSGSSHHGHGSTETAGRHQPSMLNKLDPRVHSDPATTGARHDEQHSHTGRDAALAGGAGTVAGMGVYEAEKHHGATGASSGAYDQSYTGPSSNTGYSQSSSGPVPKTVGPHDSNAANILDPRVKPQPEYQKEHATTGLDPSYAQTSGHSHESRDVAAGTGAGYVAHEGHEHEKHHRHHGPQVREDEHHHNKLHKEPKEKKEGFLHKLLHPHKKDKENELDSPDHDHSTRHGHHEKSDTMPSTGIHHDVSGQAIDPHTGLPVNASKYDTSHGYTDTNPNLAGYQEGLGG